jgi:hypothetical protein
MAIDPCPECQFLWDEYRECISKIHHLREAAEIAMFSHDREKAVALQVELISMEHKSVDARHALSEHQRGVHMHQARPSRLPPGK